MSQLGTYSDRVQRARELLGSMRHAALATVNVDGSPHNSPVFATWDDELNFYWASGQDTQHSRNVARDGRVFVVLFDSVGQGGGVYMQGVAKVLEGDDLVQALQVVNATRAQWGRASVGPESLSGDNPQRLYKATRQMVWVNVTEYDADGHITREFRQQVTPHDLR